MINKTQEEIIKHWPKGWEDALPEVSVKCLTYNHVKYIASALDGFLGQETSFAFEVIVHDDASDDGTTEIIRQYEKKYPAIIKPIYETENQYSKHDGSLGRIVDACLTGKYIAYCEGDDSWCDMHKLEKQHQYMRNNPMCTLCFSNGILKENGKAIGRVVPGTRKSSAYYKHGEADYSFAEMLFLDYVPTASLFIPSEVYHSRPKPPAEAFSGDTYIRLYCTQCGYAHCIDEDLCVYNRGVNGSVTTNWIGNIAAKNKFLVSLVNLYHYLDELTDGKYKPELSEMITSQEYMIEESECDSKGLLEKRFFKYALQNGVRSTLKYFLILLFPQLIRKRRDKNANKAR